MKYTNRIMKTGMVALLLALVFASCVPQEKMLYLKEAQMVAENQSIISMNAPSITSCSPATISIFASSTPLMSGAHLPWQATFLVGQIAARMQAFISNPTLWMRKVA